DVAGDEVPAELVADLEGALEVDPGAVPPGSRGRQAQRLGRGVGCEPCALALHARAHDGKADPGAGDRGPVRDAVAREGAADLEPVQVVSPGLDAQDLADIGHDAGEHGSLHPSPLAPPTPTVCGAWARRTDLGLARDRHYDAQVG